MKTIPDRIFEIAFAAQIPHLPFHFSSTCINPFKPFAKQNNLVFEGWCESIVVVVLIAAIKTRALLLT